MEPGMLTRDQAATMLALQARMNRRIDPDWVNAAYPYLRAVVVETAEAIEHHGWKWWKHQPCDWAQLQMEIIDIWHFLMSQLLLEHQGNETSALEPLMAAAASTPSRESLALDGHRYRLDEATLLDKLQLLSATAAIGRVELVLFAATMADCGLDWPELFRQYVGKNVLNFFRQDHGYKEGHYCKIWDGREDNEHLLEVMQELDAFQPDYQQRLYDGLAQRYRSVSA